MVELCMYVYFEPASIRQRTQKPVYIATYMSSVLLLTGPIGCSDNSIISWLPWLLWLYEPLDVPPQQDFINLISSDHLMNFQTNNGLVMQFHTPNNSQTASKVLRFSWLE